jgi:hypothetical protein
VGKASDFYRRGGFLIREWLSLIEADRFLTNESIL